MCCISKYPPINIVNTNPPSLFPDQLHVCTPRNTRTNIQQMKKVLISRTEKLCLYPTQHKGYDAA